jgi:hypothetical protein
MGKVSRYCASSTEEGNVDSLEGIQMQRLHGVFLASEGKCLSGGAGRGKKTEAGDGEITTFHDAEHFDSDSTGRADDCDSMGF